MSARRRKNLGYAAEWRKDRGCWYYRVQVERRRLRGKLDGLTDRKRDERAAWARAAQIHVDLQRQARRPEPGTLTLRQLLEHDVQRPGIRPATRRQAVEKGRRLLELLGEDTPVESITAATLEEYARARSETVAPRTVNIELTLVRSAWQRAHDDGMLSAPPKVRKLPGVRHTPTILSREEIGRLLDAAREYDAGNNKRAAGHPRLEHVLVVLANTGLRRGELFRLTWSDVDLESRTIRVLTAKRGSAGEFRVRRVPLNDAALRAIVERRAETRRRAENDRVFGSWETEGGGNRSGLWYGRLRKCCAAAGISKRVRLHDLRHSFAMMLYDGTNKNIVRVSKVLGHASPRTTMDVYLHDQPEETRVAIDGLSIEAPQRSLPPDLPPDSGRTS